MRLIGGNSRGRTTGSPTRAGCRALSRTGTGSHGGPDRVNCDGQLYTIEGIAAALLMIMTAYLVVNATSVYTAGDTHISDMQLEQLGSDALKIMDTPLVENEKSPLQKIVENPGSVNGSVNNATFGSMFLDFTNIRAGTGSDHIKYTANYICRIHPGTEIASFPLSYSRNLTLGEHAVRVTKWVTVNKGAVAFCGTTNSERAVLVEVLMWRD
jgi:hypothetical protein